MIAPAAERSVGMGMLPRGLGPAGDAGEHAGHSRTGRWSAPRLLIIINGP
jgi:hypothetical protein